VSIPFFIKEIASMRIHLIAAGLLACAAAQPAMSDVVGVPMAVSATIVKGCAIETTGPALAFPVFSGIAATPQDGTVTLSFHCSKGTAWGVTADLGGNADGGVRRMGSQTLGTTEYLPYALYADSSRLVPFPAAPTDPGAATASGTGNGLAQSVSLYGRIPVQPVFPSPDSYRDSIYLSIAY